MLITIDGPSGSGKSTVARKLARTLAFLYINQGAFFRAVGLVAMEKGLDLNSDAEMTELAKQIKFSFSELDAENKTGLQIDGVDRSEQLLSAQVAHLASQVAVHPQLRSYLLSLQKVAVEAVQEQSGVVVEGRDAGTVGFPEAELKLYLDAAADVRAQRRFSELASLGADGLPSVESLAEEMRVRDERDRKRTIAPLAVPKDAVVIDTSDRSIEDVLKHIVTLANEVRGSKE